MKTASNPYTRLLVSQVKQLLEQYEQSSVIKHNSTKGALREAYLRSFLRKLVPKECHLMGGFITDAIGQMTPQIDLIGLDSTLPKIELDDGVCVSPIESTRFWIEVKSKLETKHLHPVLDRLNVVASMEWNIIRGNVPASFKPGFLPFSFIVAFETDVTLETLKKWVSENHFIACIVVINKFAIWNITDSPEKTEYFPADGSNNETLFLAAKLHQIFVISRRALEEVRLKIASLSENPNDAEIKNIVGRENKIDMVHYGLQTYFEKSINK